MNTWFRLSQVARRNGRSELADVLARAAGRPDPLLRANIARSIVPVANRRNRDDAATYAAVLAGLARQAGLGELADALQALGRVALEDDPYSESAARRRNANLDALRLLRALQAEHARTGRWPPLTPLQGMKLREYSGWGGIDPQSIPERDWPLLQPDAREYLRIAAARLDETERIALAHGRKAKEEELTPFGPYRGAWRGLVDQYFTPLMACEGMLRWSIGAYRAHNDRDPETALEPSVGVGRMIRAWQKMGGSGMSWDAVELDPDLAAITSLLYEQVGGAPSWGPVRVFNDSFEGFAATNPDARYELMVANPPYAKRGATDALDPPGKKWKSAQHYFLWRMVRMLAPRGTMAVLTPVGVITGATGEPQRLRADLLKEAHFFGAVQVPVELFPGALLALAISLWGRRPRPLRAVLPADQAVLDGRYFDDPRFAGGVMGVTMGSLGDKYRPEAITGEWNEEVMTQQPLRQPPASYMAAAAPSVAPAPAAAKGAPQDTGDGSLARALGERLMRYRRDVEADPVRARAARAELRADLEAFYKQVHGRLPADSRTPAMVALASAFDADGRIPELAHAVEAPVGAYTGPRTLSAVFAYLTRRGEDVTPRRAEALLGRAVTTDDLFALPGAWPAPGPNGGTVFRRTEEAFSGDLWPVYDYVTALLAGAARGTFAAHKLDAQRARLLEAIAPVPLADVSISVRSKWVHARAGATSFECPLLREFIQEEYDIALGRVHVVDAWMEVEPADAIHLRAVGDLVAYFNREEETFDRKGGGHHRQDEESLDDRIARDRQRDERYSAFVKRSPEALQVEERYNRAYRGYVPRVYSDEPVELARVPAASAAKIRKHAWPAVRRAIERRGGVMALDVGLGKTIAAMLAYARMRQDGDSRRAAFVVPNTVGPNWMEEFQMWLPDYRVLPVGFTDITKPGGPLKTRSDSAKVILRKLHEFAAGGYDAMVVQHSTWQRIVVDPDRAVSYFADNFGAVREVQLDRQKAIRTLKKIADLELWLQTADPLTKKYAKTKERVKKLKVEPWLAELLERAETLEAQIGELTEGRRPQGADPDTLIPVLLEKARAQLKRVRSEVRKWAKKQTPTDRERSADQQKLDSWIAERVAPGAHPIEGITFGELGIDFIVVDEAHEYKNLYGAATRYGLRPKYMGALSEGKVVRKVWDMWIKCRLVREPRDDTGVLLLTATPMKNSPLEVYNLLSMVTRRAFEARGILTPEDHIDRYCRPQSQPVLTVHGGFREDLAVLRFSNLPELRAIFDQFVDVRYGLSPAAYAAAKAAGKDLHDVVALPVPEFDVQRLPVDMDPEQEAFYSGFRAEASQAAEAAAALLCDRDRAEVGPQIAVNGEDRLLAPELDPTDVRGRARWLRALYAEQRPVWQEALKAAGLSGIPRWDEILEAVDRNDPAAAAWVWDRWGAAKTYLAGTDIEGVLQGTNQPAAASATLEASATPLPVPPPTDPAETEGEDAQAGDLLVVIDRMSKAALDPFLLTGFAGSRLPPKYRTVARVIAGGAIEVEGRTVRAPPDCAHVIFCDYTTVYPRIKAALVDVGIDADRIELVHAGTHTAGDRQTVSHRLNAGELDVVIGGKAIEQGINLQKRSCAVHHLTFPWEPATVQQRNGRVVRQGNKLAHVNVWFYPSKRSFDGYRLSLILGKRSWMATLLTSANRAANNPASDLSGPCAVIRQLSSDPVRAAEFCECLERAAEIKSLARRRDAMIADFARFVAVSARARIDGPKQAYYADQADRLRTRLMDAPPEIFARQDLVARADEVALWWDTDNDVAWVESEHICVAGRPTLIMRVNTRKSQIVTRTLGTWLTTTTTYGEAAQRNATNDCEWDDAADRQKLAQGGGLYMASSLRSVPPAMWDRYHAELMANLERGYIEPLWSFGPGGGIFKGTLKVARALADSKGVAAPELVRPDKAGADAYLAFVRSLTPQDRVKHRQELMHAYSSYFGRTYPKALADVGQAETRSWGYTPGVTSGPLSRYATGKRLEAAS